eukprot:gene2962-1944_t
MNTPNSILPEQTALEHDHSTTHNSNKPHTVTYTFTKQIYHVFLAEFKLLHTIHNQKSLSATLSKTLYACMYTINKLKICHIQHNARYNNTIQTL